MVFSYMLNGFQQLSNLIVHGLPFVVLEDVHSVDAGEPEIAMLVLEMASSCGCLLVTPALRKSAQLRETKISR